MSIPYESSSVLDIPMPNQDSNISFPFISDGDRTTKIYNIHCVVKDADYETLELDTPMTTAALVTAEKLTSLPFAEDASAYHIGDYDHQKIDGVFRSFNRRFANIPLTNTEATGTELFTFPGLPFFTGTGAQNNITASNTSNDVTVTLTTQNDHTLVAGDTFRIFSIYTRTFYGRTFRFGQFGNKVALAGTTASTLVYRGNLTGATFVSGRIFPNSARGRNQFNSSSTTQLVREYFLPGVTTGVSTPQDIPIEPPFVAYSYNQGREVNKLNNNTIPTSLEYNLLVDSDSHLIMQETISQWFGNIIVKESKQIRAM